MFQTLLYFCCFLAISSQRKIELKLYKSNTNSAAELYTSKDEQNVTFLNINEPIGINGYSLELEGNLQYQDSNVLYIINDPELHLKIYRCIRSSQSLGSPTNLTKFGLYDDFGEKFEKYFMKKSFEMKMRDPKNKMFYYFCRGVLLDKRDFPLNISDNLDHISKYLGQSLFSDNETTSPLFDALQISENDSFSIKMQFLKGSIESLSVESFKKNVFSLITIENIIRLKDFYLSQSKYNSFKLVSFIGVGTLKTREYNFDPKNNSLIAQKEGINYYHNFTSHFSKTVEGNGLHQHLSLDFVLEAKENHFSRDVYKGKCTLIVIDYLDDTDYIDIEEMINDPLYKLITFNVIDIEKPSSVSSQHMYLLKYQIRPENKEITDNKIKINVSIKYPIHFRYRKPHESLEYKAAFVNRKPEFYFDCINLKFLSNSSVETPNDLLINGNFSKVMTVVNSSYVPLKELMVLVPTGNLQHLPIIIVVTLLTTVGSALYVALKMFGLGKAKTYSQIK